MREKHGAKNYCNSNNFIKLKIEMISAKTNTSDPGSKTKCNTL